MASIAKFDGDERAFWNKQVQDAKVREYPSPDSNNARQFLVKLAASQLAHPSRGVPGFVERKENGTFVDHLIGNEELMREWQRLDGKELIPDTMVLAGLYHSVYGTQGYQSFQFPAAKRDEIRALVGARGEATCFYTCVMERGSWTKMVLQNKDLKRGEVPIGVLKPRQSGSVVDSGYLTGLEEFTLTADEYTDMAATYLAHRLEHNEANRRYGAPGKDEAVYVALASHLGGAPEAEYKRAVAAIEAAEADGREVHGGYSHVHAEREARLTELYAEAEVTVAARL